jgi:hypothetical protein
MIGILDILKTKLNEMVIQVPVCHLEWYYQVLNTHLCLQGAQEF